MPNPPRGDLRNARDDSDAPLTQAEKANVRSKQWFKDNKTRRYTFIKEWNKRNPDRVKSYQRNYKIRLRQLTFSHYSKGDIKCACCGENTLEFLSLDHIDGNGNAHRKTMGNRGGHQTYTWLKNNNFPEGYQVLCFNCNMAKGHFGLCPHDSLTQSL